MAPDDVFTGLRHTKRNCSLTKGIRGPPHAMMKQLLKQQDVYSGVADLVQPITAAPTLAAVAAWRSIKLLKSFLSSKLIHHEYGIGSLLNGCKSWRANWEPNQPCSQSLRGRSKGFDFTNTSFSLHWCAALWKTKNKKTEPNVLKPGNNTVTSSLSISVFQNNLCA